MSPSEVEQMPSRDIGLLAMYWEEEPWGAWRDNLHAALIAREIRRPYMKDQRKLSPLSDFMLKGRTEQRETAAQRAGAFIRFMKSIAIQVSGGSRSRKTRRPPRS